MFRHVVRMWHCRYIHKPADCKYSACHVLNPDNALIFLSGFRPSLVDGCIITMNSLENLKQNYSQAQTYYLHG